MSHYFKLKQVYSRVYIPIILLSKIKFMIISFLLRGTRIYYILRFSLTHNFPILIIIKSWLFFSLIKVTKKVLPTLLSLRINI